MGSSELPKFSIIIAGGGIAGLALLRGLIKHPHLDPMVYEATAFYGDVGGGMALHKNAIMAMGSIDPDLQQAYFRSANSMLADDEVELATQVILGEGPASFKGQTIAYLGKAKGRKTVSRHDLIAAFQSTVPSDRIVFNKRLKSVRETDGKVTAEFEDGSTATADCLIGADGVHSVVRRYLLGDDHPAARPVNHDRWYRLHISLPHEIAQARVPKEWMGFVPIVIGSEGYLNMMPLHYGRTLSLSIIVQGSLTSESIDDHLNIERWSKYGPGMVEIIKLFRERRDCLDTWNIQDHDRAPVYSRGNVVMIGDAAHATTPFIGQGAAQAIEDSAVLSHLLPLVNSQHSIAPSFQAFENVRKERSQRIVESSRHAGRIYHFDFTDVPGADATSTDGIDALKKRMAEIGAFANEMDVDKQNQAAIEEFQRLIAGKGS